MDDLRILVRFEKAQGRTLTKRGKPTRWGQTARAARKLGITTSRLSMWKSRGIPRSLRLHVWQVLRTDGIKLPLDWAMPDAPTLTHGGGNGGLRHLANDQRSKLPKSPRRARKTSEATASL